MTAEPTRLFNRNFVLLWQGQFVSMMGSSVFLFTILFTLKNSTESASLIGLLMMTNGLSAFLIMPIAGAVADNYSRKNILVSCDAVGFIVVLSLSAFMFTLPSDVSNWSETQIFGFSAENLFAVHLFVVAIVLGITGGFFRPAMTAAIPDLVPKEKLETANSINMGTGQITNIVGNLVAGIVFTKLGAPLILFIDAMSYLFSAISELFIKLPKHKKPEPTHEKKGFKKLIHDTKAGFHYAKQSVGFKQFISVAIVLNFFSAPLMVLLPFYVKDHLGLNEAWYGYIIVITAVGAIIGYALAATLKPKGKARINAMSFAFLIMSIAIVVLGISTDLWVVLPGIVLVGCYVAFFNVITVTLVQRKTAEEFRGRVAGMLTTLVSIVTPLGMGVSGFVFEWLDRSIPTIYISCGVIFVFLSIYILLNRQYREFFIDESQTQATT